MKHLPALLVSLVLVACSTTAPTDSTDGMSTSSKSFDITVAFAQTTSEDANGIMKTDATLTFSGAAMQNEVSLGDNVQGQLEFVNPASYPANPNGKTIALFTTWFAGQGEEILLTQATDGKLWITHRYGDESGTCTEWEAIAEVPAPADATIKVEGLTAPIDASSLAFCNQ